MGLDRTINNSSAVADTVLGPDAHKFQTLVSIQSVSLGDLTRQHLPGISHFEDRNLYLVEFLRRPQKSAIFVVSNDPDEGLIRYHLTITAQCLNMDIADINQRVAFVRIQSRGSSSLTQRLLEDKGQFSLLQEAIKQSHRPFLDFWAVSDLEVELARRLQLSYFGPPAGALGLDAKSSARKIFAQAGIAHPLGQEGLSSFAEVQSALQDLASKSNAISFLIKLNNEEAGNGIGKVERQAIGLSEGQFRAAIEVSKDIPLAAFETRLKEDGCVVEEFVEYQQIANPSVKMCIQNDGTVLNLATHDQVLTNLAYSGSIFPAEPAYRSRLVRSGIQIANFLKDHGVRGVFSVDFLAGRNNQLEDWSLWALEINIRKGATTHPYFWTRVLTAADYDESSGELKVSGRQVVYISSEYIHSISLKRFTPLQLIKLLQEAGIIFDPSTRTGVFVHMATSMREHAKIGATIIASDHIHAFDLLAQLNALVSNLEP